MTDAVLELLIPLSAIVMGLGIGFWAIYWEHRRKQMQYEERRLMIEKGMTPPEILGGERKASTPEDCLRRGTILVFLGIGLGIAYFVLRGASDGPPSWLAGAGGGIVGLLGVGNLVYYFIAKDRGATAGSAQGRN